MGAAQLPFRTADGDDKVPDRDKSFWLLDNLDVRLQMKSRTPVTRTVLFLEWKGRGNRRGSQTTT